MGDDEKKSEKVDFVRWFSELSNKDVPIAGGKGASLGEMYNHKFPIPPGFVVTAQAYRYFIEKTGIREEMKDALSGLDINDTDALNEASKKVREIIEREEFPQEMKDEILEAYDVLDVDKSKINGAGGGAMEILKNSHEPPFVAVRSSATAEDLADASFAGQQESFLNVKGEKKLMEKVRKCFSSLFTPRAIYYREKKGFDHFETALSAVVQKMIDSEKSGVMFSKNPIKNDNTVMIEAVWGLGEGIVSGRIKPDNYIVDRDIEKFDIKKAEVSEKKVAIVRDSSGENTVVKLTSERANQRVLNNYEIKRLAQYALQLEEHYELPQDIEFAIENNEIYIVQSRPITTKASAQGSSEEVSGTAILSGLGASPGVSAGTVKIIHDLSELSKVKKGDVLVTEMTNPDMVVAMQRSAAIVTDEGGITCFSGDTKVLTKNGFREIKEVAEKVNSGEEVLLLTYDSKKMGPAWKRILSAAGRKRKAIRVSVSQKGLMDHNTLDLTADHKMIVFENRELIKKEVGKILEENGYVSVVDSLPKTVKASNEKLAYLLGAILSDGSINLVKHKTGNLRRGSTIFIQKDTKEKEEFIQTVRDNFEECFGERFAEPREKVSRSYIRGRLVQGVAQSHICSKMGPALAINKISQNLDSWILGMDEFSCLNFLAGLIDGDGCLHNSGLNIYVAKENVLQGIILACLNLGIFPQITKNREIHRVQILERISDILDYCKRVKGEVKKKHLGNKLISAKQIVADVIEQVNYKGKVKPYVNGNLLLDLKKVERDILPIVSGDLKDQLSKILKSNLRSQRVKKITDLGKIEVYNLEVEADNEIDHNFVVFTKKYTPLLVSNSHAAIVSREMGIPAVVGTGEATSKLKDGQVITVDGNSGKVLEGRGETKAVEIHPVVETKTKIKVIVDLPDFAERAAKSKCKAVGLTRLEGIIASSGKHPLKFVKEKNMEGYVEIIYKGLKKIATPFEEIWVRSSDIRSDEYRNLEGAPKEVEGNPMLGDHGIRFSLRHPEILKAELTAIKEVADDFPDKKVGIMMPQIISVSELKETKRIAREEVGVPKNVRIGIMVETPAAVQLINDFCEEGTDFISFGTNDLTQYTLAIDRNNGDVQYLYDETHPAVVSAIRYVIRRCKKYGVETSICGQAGSRPEMVKILVAEGISSISVNADAAAKISEVVAKVESGSGADESEKEESPKEKVVEELSEMSESGDKKINPEERKEIIEESDKLSDEQVHDALENEENSNSDKSQGSQIVENDAEDIEQTILGELEDDPKEVGTSEYNPGSLGNRNEDIPPLNEAIPVGSDDLNQGNGEQELDFNQILEDNVEKGAEEALGVKESSEKRHSESIGKEWKPQREDTKLDIF